MLALIALRAREPILAPQPRHHRRQPARPRGLLRPQRRPVRLAAAAGGCVSFPPYLGAVVSKPCAPPMTLHVFHSRTDPRRGHTPPRVRRIPRRPDRARRSTHRRPGRASPELSEAAVTAMAKPATSAAPPTSRSRSPAASTATPNSGCPPKIGAMLIRDATTGAPRAVLADEGWLTASRTAAAGALITNTLTPPEVTEAAASKAPREPRVSSPQPPPLRPSRRPTPLPSGRGMCRRLIAACSSSGTGRREDQPR